MRILVVEDDKPIADLLTRGLREECYAVDTAYDGLEGEWLAFEHTYDAIILDLMLPVKSGLDVLKAIREGGITTPILILTAKDAVSDVVKGLDLGADDYMTKPFSLEVLFARVRSLLRRQAALDLTVLRADPISLDTAKKEVTIAGEVIDFTAKEFALMEYFVRNPNVVLSRTKLSEHVWDMNFEPSSNVVDVYIGYLRSKLEKYCGSNLIRTVRGHGYMFEPNQAAGSL